MVIHVNRLFVSTQSPNVLTGVLVPASMGDSTRVLWKKEPQKSRNKPRSRKLLALSCYSLFQKQRETEQQAVSSFPLTLAGKDQGGSLY